MMLAKTKIDGETFTHKILWQCCLMQIETARRRKRGAQYFHMSAMLMAYLTYEAYINFLGERLAPDEWAKEREFFRKEPYQGIEGKLKLISEKSFIVGIEKGKRPYQTIINLKKFRDFLSHGKPNKYSKTIQHTRDNMPPLFGNYDKIDSLVTPEQAEIAVEDVEEFIRFLHEQVKKINKFDTPDSWIMQDSPLNGALGHVSSETSTNRLTDL